MKPKPEISPLSDEEKLLVKLRDELYQGEWAPMAEDLKARLDGRPFVFKLVHRIQDDLERIVRLRELETKFGIDLAEYIQ